GRDAPAPAPSDPSRRSSRPPGRRGSRSRTWAAPEAARPKLAGEARAHARNLERLLSSRGKPPRMRQDDVPVRPGGAHRAIGQDAGLDIEEGGSLQSDRKSVV